MNNCVASNQIVIKHFSGRHPRMSLSGVQFRIRLDSRLKHAGMTDFGLALATQQDMRKEP